MIQTSLPILELHSSEITAHCLRAIKLRHEGKVKASMTTALFRGLLAGEVLRLIHQSNFSMSVTNAVLEGLELVHATAQQENRPYSDSVKAEMHTIGAEVEKVCVYYVARMKDWFAKCRFIGCEVPVRLTLTIDDEPVDFASHLDLLVRFPDGTLVFDDWKWREETPTAAYLARYMQFGLYALMLRHGEALVNDEWVSFAQWPLGRWIHLPNLKPYARNGADYKAGEHRDIEKIIRTVPYDDKCEPFIRNELTERVRMWRMGLFPTNPEPVGCFICESKSWCPQMSIDFGGVE